MNRYVYLLINFKIRKNLINLSNSFLLNRFYFEFLINNKIKSSSLYVLN